jgi:hypothetical protein
LSASTHRVLTAALEVHEVLERPLVRRRRCPEHDPLVELVLRRDLLDDPADVRHEERDCPRNARELVVVEEDDPLRAKQSPEVPEVDEDAVEAVVSVDDGEVEPAALLEEGRQRELGAAWVELDEVAEPGIVE